MPDRDHRNTTFWAVLFVLLLGLLELGAFLLSIGYPKFYSHEALALRLLRDREASYPVFLEGRYDPVTGWRNPPSQTFETHRIVCRSATYSYDALGARSLNGQGPDPVGVRIIAVGDSFTNGDDVDFAQSYPEQLGKLTGVKVANHGVSGFGPLQAALQFEQVAPTYPNADIAVLGIMHGDIRRHINPYRPILYKSGREVFSFKPYVQLTEDGPQIRKNPNAPPLTNIEDLVTLAETLFENAYWEKEEARFPYSISFVKALTRNSFRKSLFGKVVGRLGGTGLQFEYADKALTDALTLTIDKFVSTAGARSIKPVIAFIPRAGGDRTVSDEYAETLRTRYGDEALVMGVGRAEIDWRNYPSGGSCHPTPYGYNAIAQAIFDAIVDRGWLPEPVAAGGP